MPMFGFNLCWSVENGKFSTKAELGEKYSMRKDLFVGYAFKSTMVLYRPFLYAFQPVCHPSIAQS